MEIPVPILGPDLMDPRKFELIKGAPARKRIGEAAAEL